MHFSCFLFIVLFIFETTMSVVFGVHLGNTSACLACYKDGKVDVIVNDVGERLTPAVVTVNETEKIVGCSAKAGLARYNTSTVVCNKQYLCEWKGDGEINGMSSKMPYKVVRNGSSFKYVLRHGEKIFDVTPELIAVCLFKKLYEIASSSGNSTQDLKVVLCVPLYFTKYSRMTLMHAAEEAGFEVLHVISEPAATMLGYELGVQNPEEGMTCLVYRLGGATLDVSIIEVQAGMYSVRSSVHRHDLGGNRFTTVLAEYLAEEYRKKCKLDPLESRRSMAKLTAAAEMCKHVLSSVSTAHCFVESLCEGVDFSYNITRARFESLISPLMQEYIDPIQEALKDAGMDGCTIQKVLLSGGSVKAPKVQQTVVELFPQAQHVNGTSADEVIALGAARQASYLSEPVDPESERLAHELPAVAFPIHVKGPNVISDCIIPADTPVPVKRARKYNIENAADDLCFELFEVHSEDIKILGKLCLRHTCIPVEVTLEVHLNSSGGLYALLSDSSCQKKVTLKLDAPLP